MSSQDLLKINRTEVSFFFHFTQQFCLVQTIQYYIFNITERYLQRPTCKSALSLIYVVQQVVHLYRIARFSTKIFQLECISTLWNILVEFSLYHIVSASPFLSKTTGINSKHCSRHFISLQQEHFKREKLPVSQSIEDLKWPFSSYYRIS